MGDFVQAGLPRDFVRAWDAWVSAVLPAARDLLAEHWTDSWKRGPLWRFVFAPGVCGGRAALGVWMPSVDRVGREFPIVVAGIDDDWPEDEEAGRFLAAAEFAARAVVEGRLGVGGINAELLARKATAVGLPRKRGERDALWWTDGARLVLPRVRESRGLPDRATFAAMLSDEVGG